MNVIDEKSEVIGGEYLGCQVDCNFTFGKAFIRLDSGKKIILDSTQVQYYKVISHKNGTTKLARNITDTVFGLVGKAILEHKKGRVSFCVEIFFLGGKTSLIACEETVYKAIKRYCRVKTSNFSLNQSSDFTESTKEEDDHQDNGCDDFETI